jgi:hypothetical protein
MGQFFLRNPLLRPMPLQNRAEGLRNVVHEVDIAGPVAYSPRPMSTVPMGTGRFWGRGGVVWIG